MEPYFLPPEIWRYIFEFVAADSRAYLIPLRRVCRAWRLLAKVVPARFTCAMTRLLTVSARDCLPGLCNWAHEGGGAVGRDALVATARTGDVDLVTLVHGWTDGAAIAGMESECLIEHPMISRFSYVLLTRTRIARMFPQRLNEFQRKFRKSSIVEKMLLAAAEAGHVEICRYLLDRHDMGDLFEVIMIAAINDDKSLLRLCEEKCPHGSFNRALKSLVVMAAINNSLGILKIIEDRKLYGPTRFWKLVFLGAVMGFQSDLYETAKARLDNRLERVSPIDCTVYGEHSLINVAAIYAGETSGRSIMIRKLVRDGGDNVLAQLAWVADYGMDHVLGRLVIELGGDFSEISLEAWEDMEEGRCRPDNKRCRVENDEDAGCLSD